MERGHRYTDLADFNKQAKSRVNVDEDVFEVVIAEKEEDDRFEEEQVEFLREEDEIIQALHVCGSKNFSDFIPKKSESQLISELNVEGLMQIQNENVKFFCKNHLNKKANFICVNKSCEYTLYCMSCRKQHDKCCNRKFMSLNVNQIRNQDFVDEYFDVADFGFNEQIDRVKELVGGKRDKLNELLNVFEKTLVNKVKLQSKEFKLRQIKGFIEDAHQKFTGGSDQKTPLRRAFTRWRWRTSSSSVSRKWSSSSPSIPTRPKSRTCSRPWTRSSRA